MNEDSSKRVILDPSVLKNLPIPINPALFIRQIVGIFERHGRTSVEQLTTAFAQGDGETLKQVAHRLKGSCLNVGAVGMAEALRTLEQSSQNASPSQEMQELIDSLQGLLEDTCKQLKLLN